MATKINLLDWRATRRRERQQQFTRQFGLGLGAALALVGLGYVTVGQRIEAQGARNQYLSDQIALLDKQIKEIQELEKVKQSLISRMRVIEQLQQSRSASVHFFDEIVNTTPDGVYLTGIRQNGATVTIDGVAESSGRVSTYLKNLDSSPWFKDPKLVVIKTGETNKQRNSTFTLTVTNLTKASDNPAQPTEVKP